MSVASIATGEHPEDVAALDHQFAASPPKDDHEDIWPLDTTKAEKVQDDAGKAGEAATPTDGEKFKLAGGKDGLHSGKALHHA
ncbi:hypothetical protein diail_2331 [Diaporthe ilicicola]|nr:hypothetical protein diail_2331 [Diaporthe ilicicola]